MCPLRSLFETFSSSRRQQARDDIKLETMQDKDVASSIGYLIASWHDTDTRNDEMDAYLFCASGAYGLGRGLVCGCCDGERSDVKQHVA